MLDVQCLVKSLHSGLRRGKILQEHSPDGPPDPSKPFSARTVLAARSSPRFLCGLVVKDAGCGAGVDDVVDDGGGEFGVALDGEDVGEWAGRGGERVGFEKGVDGVARGGEQEGASRREGGHVVFVHLLDVHFIPTALALYVACPPVPPLVCQLASVDANFPAVVSGDALAAQGDGEDLVAETDADEFEVLVRGRGGEGADKVDEGGDEGVGCVVCGVFGAGEHDTVICVGCGVLQSLGRGVRFLVDDVVGVDDEAGAAGDGGVGVGGEGVCEPFGVDGMVCGVSGGGGGGTYSCRTL